MNTQYSVRTQTDILHKSDSSAFSTGGMARRQNFDLFVDKSFDEVTYLCETGPSRAILMSGIQ